jgi:hypothetical protein
MDGEVGSQDHAALSISIDLQRALHAVPDRGARCARTLRHVGHVRQQFVSALQTREADLLLVNAAMENGTTTWGEAVQQLLDLVRECALSVSAAPVPRAPGSHAPWFDQSCIGTRDAFRIAWVVWWHANNHPLMFHAADVALLGDAMLDARREYHRAVRPAKRAHELQHQEQLIETYSSDRQRDFGGC